MEADYFGLQNMVNFIDKFAAFDVGVKSPNVTVTSNTATNEASRTWETAYFPLVTTGSHAYIIEWVAGSSLMVGVCGASADTKRQGGVYSQGYSMMLSSTGQLFVAASASKNLTKYAVGNAVIMSINCGTRIVSWTVQGTTYNETLHPSIQPPYRLCVDLPLGSSVTTHM